MKYINSSSIECTRCGKEVSLDFTRCPNCGLYLYPDDSEEFDVIDVGKGRNLSVSITSIVLGWISAAIVIFIANYFFKEQIGFSPYQKIIISIIGIGGVILGGFVSGFVSSEKSIWEGIGVGVLSIGTDILYVMFWWNLREVGLSWIENGITWVFMILGGIVGRNLAYIFPHSRAEYKFPEDEYKLYQELFYRVQRNHEVVERLIAYERERAPNTTRTIWLRTALERWERDNRL